MRIEMDWDESVLADVVKNTKYLMPGWMVWIGQDNEGAGAPTLHIRSNTPDSYNMDEMMPVNHSFLIPLATYNRRTWVAWVRDCFAKAWDHEIGEMLLFDGFRQFAPHHGNGEDPYRVWHVGDLRDTQVRAGEFKNDNECAYCGGAGCSVCNRAQQGMG